MVDIARAAVSQGMSNDRRVDAKGDEPTGRKFNFTIPMTKNRGHWLVEGQWRYEGAEEELATVLAKIAADMVHEGKLWWDGKELRKGPRPAPVPPPPPSKLEVALQAFDATRDTEKLEKLLRSIGSTIEQMREYSSSLAEAGGSDAVDPNTIEDVLGSALLLCQAHMNAVLLRVDAIRPLVWRRKSVRNTLLAEGHRTRDLVELPTKRKIGSYSLFEVLWALADFYKQRERWPTNWTNAQADTKRTISILSAAGITQQTPNKLEVGVQAIGVSDARLDYLGIVCDAWGDMLSDGINRALRR